MRVTDPGNRAHFYDYDPLRGRIVRYLAPLGMDTRGEDQPPPPPTTTTTTPPNCPPPPGQPPFCDVPIGGGSGSFPPVDFQGARTYDYDDAGFQSTIRDENANSITLTHDQRGNITARATCRTGPTDCQTAYFEYFPVGANLTDPRLDKVVAARDGRSSGPADNHYSTAYTYTTLGLLESQTTPDGALVQHTYTAAGDPAFGGGGTPAGLVATSTDPRGAVTRYAYFSTGDLAEVRSPSGLRTQYTYDTLGRAVTTTQFSDSSPQGVTTTSSYDKLSRTTTVTGPAIPNPVTHLTHTARHTASYDADGNPTRVEESDLSGGDPTRVTQLDYDEHSHLARVTDAEGGETSFGYDPFGNRTRMVNAAGVQYEFAYTARNMLAEVRLRGWNGDPGAPQPGPTDYLVLNAYAYDLAGELVRSTDALGRATRYRYYNDGLLRQVIAAGIHNPDGSVRDLVLADYAYDAAGSLARQTAAGGLVTTYQTDAAGRRTVTTADPDGLARRTALRYDLAGNITQVALSGKESNTGVFDDGLAETVDYGYDTAGRQTSQTLHTGTEDLTTNWTYDQRGLPTSVTDPRGTGTGADPAAYTTNFGYDQAGRPTTVTAPPVQVETAGGQPVTVRPVQTSGYDTFGNPTDIVDGNGNTSRNGFDKVGRLVSATSPNYTPPGATQQINATTHLEYDPLGQLVSTTGPRNAITRYGYDQLGRLVTRTDPNPANPADAGGTWRYTYTRTGELLSATDPTGARTESTYDDLGRQVTSSVLERSPAAGTFTAAIGYDDAGNLRSAAAPSGATSHNDYDLLGQLIRVTNPANVVAQLGYDRSGRLVKTTDAAGRTHRTNIDLAGRATKEIDTAPGAGLIRQTRLSYDRAGNLTTVTDPLNHTTQLTHDALDRLTQQVEPTSATDSITTSIGYDSAGNRTRYTDGRGNTTGYTYNTWGLPESVIEPATTAHPNPDQRTWTTSYDASANPVTLAAPGGVRQDRTFDRTFDGTDQLTRVTGTGAEAPTPAKTFGYDLLGRLTTSSAPGGTNTFTYNDRGALLSTSGPSGNSSFDYDADGNLTTRTDAAGTSRYGYTNDRLTTLRDGITGVAQTLGYDSAGQVSTLDYGGGRTRTLTYDNLARLNTDTLTAGTTTLAATTYGYDLNNWLSSKTTQGGAGAGSNTYGYDFAGRLTTWTTNGTTTNYTYDPAGNRTSAAGRTATYDQRNRLITDGTSSYTYTPRGTLAAKTTGTTTQTSSFDAYDRLTTQGLAHYTHDALDRVATRNGTPLAYTGATNELATDGTTRLARGPNAELLAQARGTDTRLTLADLHGDITATLNPTTPTLPDTTTYDPFGNPTHTSGTPGPIGYQGDYIDPDTHQINMTARWYDPTTTTFTTRDTYGPTNRYTYANSSPLNHTDPTGHVPIVSDNCWGVPGSNPSQNCYPLYPWPRGKAGSSLGPLPRGCGGNPAGGLDFGNPCCPAGLDIASCLGLPKPPPIRRITGPGQGNAVGSIITGGRTGSPASARPDPTIAAREATRTAARNNPLPIPQALIAPANAAGAPPVSSAPNLPSHTTSDYRDTVDDVNRSYQNLLDSITVPSETLLGHIKDTIAAPSETTQASLPFKTDDNNPVTTTGAAPPPAAPSNPTTAPSTPPTHVSNDQAESIYEWEVAMNREGGGCIAEIFILCVAYDLYLADPINCATNRTLSACAQSAIGAATAGFSSLYKEISKIPRKAIGVADGGPFAIIDKSIHALRPQEQNTVVRLSNRPEFAGRTFSKSPHEGADFVDDLGRSYDQMGDGTKAQFQGNMKQFKASLDHHLYCKPANNFTVVDLTGYSLEQAAEVRAYYDSLPIEIRAKVIRLGW